MTPIQDHWSLHARQWPHMGPPLRPCGQDVRMFEDLFASWHTDMALAAPVALLLGVTPEIEAMQWPGRTRLLAVDHNLEMIRHVWPGTAGCDSMVICGRWQEPPVAPASAHMVIGDGCFTPLPFPEAYIRVAESLHHVLSPEGCLILRFFTRPPAAQPVSEVLADLEKGKIRSFHAFKWRLAWALHGPSAEDGVCIGDIWQAWHTANVDKNRIGRMLGWTPETMATINNYQGRTTRYTFPTKDEVRNIFAPLFKETGCMTGTYELADQCPIFRFSPRI
ncbi:MAG: hypothetical protein ACOZBW_03010 [Thermodesulfobacteriota bacterium]